MTSWSGSGSAITELKQLELPAISLTGPDAVTPAPSAQAMLSPAPATTGTPGGRPRRRASVGRISPAMLQEGTTCGERGRVQAEAGQQI